ncbi:FMN-binding glutamate synthase family protein [Corynebacterium pseudopelargi]|uniref:Glutamate synthase [NADPH] large chain n=1 Tax=Corynebacterium pseudopelargi TaxID=2080757 RepID=A0A3G6IV47_9CORY|nr:FMN-binding glutamate synthase family protein [Corynebacterium pseudopelargi]AZA09649.1 Glutamate synthase [NADPH] large chain [Corynebacterium pseudopelargi]
MAGVFKKTAGTVAGAFGAIAAWDLSQRKHAIKRNFPIIGNARYLLESIRPEIQQYFVESNTDGRPFDRVTRSMIYERAKGIHSVTAFGTELDIQALGYDHLLHTVSPVPVMKEAPKIHIGGPDCTQPFDTSLLNISSMSFGALSSRAVLAMNKGAAKGGFIQETGEGGLTKYHLEYGAPLIWELGSGFFGARTKDGRFDPEQFQKKAANENVKGILIKLSQGAKPGMGGQLPGEKVTEEIAEARGVEPGKTVISPAANPEFSTPRELMEFIAKVRDLAGGKPVGFKLCVGSRVEFLAMCKAMLETGITPDFIHVDGSEGGTGAAPGEYADHMGTPLSEGLIVVQNALVGCGLRDKIAIGAAGKVAAGNDIIKRLALGADYCNAARPMMMAVGCIQAQKCQTNRCPTGVATQNKWLAHGIDIDDKGERVYQYQKATVESAMHLLASMGLDDFDALGPRHVVRRVDEYHLVTYADIAEWLEPNALLEGTASDSWAKDFETANADRFQEPAAAHIRSGASRKAAKEFSAQVRESKNQNDGE